MKNYFSKKIVKIKFTPLNIPKLIYYCLSFLMPFFAKFKKSLHSLDLFGIQPTLYFNGQKKSGTCFGFGLSLLLFAFTTLCFFFFGQDLYYQQNPQIRYNEEYDPFPKEITIDPEHSPIMIEINSVFGEVFYTNPNLINVNVSQIILKKTENGSIFSMENYRMEICTRDHFEKLDQSAKQYFLNMSFPNHQIHSFNLQ